MFFRAGVLGQMEEFRDERLGKIMSWMQAWARGYLSRKGFKKLQEQRVALKVVQRNLRKYLQLRTWPWYKLWQKIKPLLNVSRIEDEIAVSINPLQLIRLGQTFSADIYNIYIYSCHICLHCLAGAFIGLNLVAQLLLAIKRSPGMSIPALSPVIGQTTAAAPRSNVHTYTIYIYIGI